VKLFADAPIRSGTMLMAATGLVLYSLVFIIPVFMDRQVGMDATHTGYLYIPGSIATMLVMPIVGKFLQKLGVKFFVSVGGILICGCLWLLSSFSVGIGAPQLFWPLMLRGMGLGCLFVPINAAVLSQYEGEQLGQAAGLLNLFRQIGGSFGIAGMSTFLDRYSAQYRNNLRAQVNYSNPVAVDSVQKATHSLLGKLSLWHGLSPGTIGLQKAATAGIGSLQGRMETQVFQLAFNRLMMLVFSVYLLSIFPLWRMKLRKKVGAVQAH
jgi:DHA2 family multidrug resistance protein